MIETDKVNQWLTLGANLGVLIGLLLLVVELDQNSDLIRAQVHQARSDNFGALGQQVADSERLLPALLKFKDAGGPDDLSALKVLDPLERERVRTYYSSRLQEYDNLYYQYRNGFLDEDFYRIRVVTTIRRLTPLWIELRLIRLGAENPYVTTKFAAEVERIHSTK